MTAIARDYQSAGIDGVRAKFASGAKRVLYVAPTGSGKGFMISFMALHAAAKGRRVYVIIHRPELVDQLSTSLREMDVRHGRIQPGWTPSTWQVQVAMVQTLTRRLDKYPAPDFLLFDEAHHIIAPTYQRIADHWPNAKVVGFTATPLRLDGRGLGAVFDTMVVGPTTRELIDANWLADFDYLAPPSKLDLSRVSIRAGDYAIDELAAATDKVTITGDMIAHLRQYLDRRPTIAFAVRVDHAEHIAEQARSMGIKAVSVDGSLDPIERKARIAGLANGNTELLTSCDLVGEGLDIPAVSGAILARRTKSLAMLLQWVGRTLRPKDDGSRAVILDHVGCVHEHGLPDAPRVWTLDDKKRREPPTPIQTCDKCYRVFATGPGWRAAADCQRGTPPGCILTPEDNPAPGAWKPPEAVAGELQRVVSSPSWTGGIDILRASGDQWKTLLARAQTYAELDEIRKLRGYSPFWVRHILKSRAGRFRSVTQRSLPLILENTTETPVLRDTLVAVTALPGCMFWRNNTGVARTMDGRWIRFGLVGSGDIIGSCRGRAVAIETKRPKGGRYSQEQRDFAVAWTLAGGLYVPATQAEQALAALAEIP